MSSEWNRMLVAAWEEAGRPSYRQLGRITRVNHEACRQALNGSGASSLKTIRGLADALCKPPDNDAVVAAWEEKNVRPDGVLPRRAEFRINTGSRQLRKLYREYRENQKLSQRRVAEKLQVNQAALSELELYDRSHSLDLLARWAEALDVEFGVYVVLDGNFIAIKCTPDDTEEESA